MQRGCRCSMEDGQSGVTGPSRAFFTAGAFLDSGTEAMMFLLFMIC